MMRHIVTLLMYESSLGFQVMLRRTNFGQVEWHCNHTHPLDVHMSVQPAIRIKLRNIVCACYSR